MSIDGCQGEAFASLAGGNENWVAYSTLRQDADFVRQFWRDDVVDRSVLNDIERRWTAAKAVRAASATTR
jgi:hypothetical protein